MATFPLALFKISSTFMIFIAEHLKNSHLFSQSVQCSNIPDCNVGTRTLILLVCMYIIILLPEIVNPLQRILYINDVRVS